MERRRNPGVIGIESDCPRRERLSRRLFHPAGREASPGSRVIRRFATCWPESRQRRLASLRSLREPVVLLLTNVNLV